MNFDLLIDFLKNWREDDHEDFITLSRNEIVVLLEDLDNIHKDCI